MAKAIKGCTNQNCSSWQKKTKYSIKENYCSICGSQLSFVCRHCWMQLEDNESGYCIRCEVERKDHHDEIGKFILGKTVDSIKAVPGTIEKITKRGDEKKVVAPNHKSAEAKAKRIKIFGAGELIIPGKFNKENQKIPFANKVVMPEDVFIAKEDGLKCYLTMVFSLNDSAEVISFGSKKKQLFAERAITKDGKELSYEICAEEFTDGEKQYLVNMFLTVNQGALKIILVLKADEEAASSEEAAQVIMNEFIAFIKENN